MNVRVITHTGSDITPEEASALGVELIYDHILFKGKEYPALADTVDLGMMLSSASDQPTTSHPSIGDFFEAFEKSEKDCESVFLSVTSDMSGTYATGCAAVGLMDEDGNGTPARIYDTRLCSYGTGMLVYEAARLAAEGLTADRIIRELDAVKEKISVRFLLDTLQYARRGGRCGLIKTLAADLLGIKPILWFSDGFVREKGIARRFSDGLSTLKSEFNNTADFSRLITVYHCCSPTQAELFAADLKNDHPELNIRIRPIGPVIGIYTGPGCVGLAYWTK